VAHAAASRVTFCADATAPEAATAAAMKTVTGIRMREF
jgi:hypothetical protein